MGKSRGQPVYGLRKKGQEDEEDATEKEESKGNPSWRSFVTEPYHLQGTAKYFPLIASISAPLATLLDIPALTVCLRHPFVLTDDHHVSNIGMTNLAKVKRIPLLPSSYLPSHSLSASSQMSSSSSGSR